MPIPATIFKPSFDITRASHVVLGVRDLAASRAFYVDTLGFVVTEEAPGVLWLRGLEEQCHHSVVIRSTTGSPACTRVGLRAQTEEDLDLIAAHFAGHGLQTTWVEMPHQGRTLHTQDVAGVPLEICVSMETRPRLLMSVDQFKGGCPLRMDHMQMWTPRVQESCDFYMGMGFRLSNYVVPDGSDELFMAFLHRKGTPFDLVFTRRDGGPRLHHFAFVSPEPQHLMVVADLCAQHGFGANIEHGPGRHFGPGLTRFVYMRDPDGHRVEFFTNQYQVMDFEDEPLRWEQSQIVRGGWGGPPPRSWLEEASPFAERP